MAKNNTKVVSDHQREIRQITERWFFGTAKTTMVYFRKSFTQKGWLDNGFQGWAKRKNTYAWPILRKTDNMYDGFEISRGNNSYIITNKAEYASYHNEGTNRLPKRQFMVEKEEELPRELKNILYDRLESALRKVLNK